MTWEGALELLSSADSPSAIEASQFALGSPMVQGTAALEAYARESFPPGRNLLEAVSELMGRIHADFVFDPRFSTVATPVAKVFAHKRGVCQDCAHLGIACLRMLGLPTRYVSGYIETQPPEGAERLVGADASHAWVSVYLLDAGCVDFDPTNDCIVGDTQFLTAWGRDYSDVTSLKGVIFGGGALHMTRVAVDVDAHRRRERWQRFGTGTG